MPHPYAPDPSSPIDDQHHRTYPKISADPVAMAKLANLYHWAEIPGHGPEDCVGYDDCVSATSISMDGLKAVADAVQTHINHRVVQGLQDLRNEVAASLAEGGQL